ncbi:hypothetical protein SAMN04488593_0346 [Microbacterium azadirachtae]|nr:hypothetical protein SAMN04488593_0346 [Microbacterium azadirachtae]SEF51942.1 hypothetical protein SAMN04488594_0336 [Microbacterium azadirachtae]SEF52046.1 hypothetical protein SAMN04488592_0345 [Microbacterium azadirachtae]
MDPTDQYARGGHVVHSRNLGLEHRRDRHRLGVNGIQGFATDGYPHPCTACQFEDRPDTSRVVWDVGSCLRHPHVGPGQLVPSITDFDALIPLRRGPRSERRPSYADHKCESLTVDEIGRGILPWRAIDVRWKSRLRRRMALRSLGGAPCDLAVQGGLPLEHTRAGDVRVLTVAPHAKLPHTEPRIVAGLDSEGESNRLRSRHGVIMLPESRPRNPCLDVVADELGLAERTTTA